MKQNFLRKLCSAYAALTIVLFSTDVMATATLTDLGNLGYSSSAYGVSDDGKVVVGEGQETNGGEYSAFKWTKSGGMTILGSLVTNSSPGECNTSATGVSKDGKVIIGYSATDSLESAVARWVNDVVEELDSTYSYNSYAYATNRDGSVIAGYAYNDSSGNDSAMRAFIWNDSDKQITI